MASTVRNILLEVAGETVQAQRSLHELGDELRGLPDRKEISIRADASRAMRRIGEVEAKLRQVDRTKVSPEMNVQITKALLELEAFRRKANEIGSKTYTTRLEVDADRNELARMEGSILRVVKALDKASRPARTFGDAMGDVVQTIKAVTPVLNGLSIIIAVKLVSGLLALAGSAAAALSGLVVLGVGALAALGPLVGILIALFTSISRVLQVLKLQDTATKQTAAKQRAGAQAAATAADQHRAALERVQDAERQVGLAAEEVARATVAAYREMEDAAERVTDAVRGIDDAELNLDESKLQLEEARQALKDFAEQAGISRAVFEKFTNVDAPFDRGELQGALKGEKPEDKLELERLILDVRRAKLDERDATDQLSDSERELKRARQDNAAFLRDGIAASQTYSSAVRSQKDAVRNLARAQDDLANGAGGLSTAAAAAGVATDKLTASELRLLNAIKRVRSRLRGFFSDITDPILDSITKAISRLPTLLGPMKGAFKVLAGSIASVIDALSKESVRPEFVLGWAGITTLAGRLVKILGSRVFVSFLRILRNVGLVTLPIINALLARFAGWLEGIANRSGDLAGLNTAIRPLVHSLLAVLRFIGAIVEAFIQFGIVVGPIGDELLGWLTGAVKDFTKWLKTAKGQEEVKQFFEDTLPAVKSLVGFIFRLIKVGLLLFQVLSPVIKGMFDGFNFILDVVILLLGVLADITHNPIVSWVLELVGSFLGFGAVLRIVARVFKAIKEFGGFVRVFKAFGKFLIKPFVEAFNGIIRLVAKFSPKLAAKLQVAVLSAVRAVGQAAAAVIRLGGRIIVWVAKGIAKAARLIFDAGKSIVGFFRRGIENLVRVIFGAGRWVVQRIIAGAKSIAGAVFNLGKDLLHGLIKGFTTIGGKVLSAIKGLANKIVDLVKDVLGISSPSKVMQELGAFMLEGLIKGFTSGNIVDFIKDHLGGIPALAAKLVKSTIDPFQLQQDALKLGFDLGKDLIGGIPGLAAGGLVKGRTFAELGEGAHKEAVVPLSRQVLKKLGAAIAASMTPSAAALPGGGALAGLAPLGAAGRGQVIEHVDVHLPAPPAGGIGDPRYSAVQLGRELRRRGRSVGR